MLVVQNSSIKMSPLGSDNLKRAAMRELFPVPVLPTMPTCKETQGDEELTGCKKPRRKPDC